MAGSSVTISVKDNWKDAPRWSLESDLNGEATYRDIAKFTQRAVYLISQEALAEEQAKGFDKSPRVRTDNRWEKPPEQVKPFGKIEYYSRMNAGQMILDAYVDLLRKSPLKTRQYLASHYVYHNNKKIAESFSELQAWVKMKSAEVLKGGDYVRIVNVMPYAARLEVRGIRRGTTGKNKGKNYTKLLKSTIGTGAYYLAARTIRDKYKASGSIRFEMLPNGTRGLNIVPTRGKQLYRTSYISDAERMAQWTRRKAKPKFRKRFSGPYVYPSISFLISKEGIR